jgi:hypothetical protein
MLSWTQHVQRKRIYSASVTTRQSHYQQPAKPACFQVSPPKVLQALLTWSQGDLCGVHSSPGWLLVHRERLCSGAQSAKPGLLLSSFPGCKASSGKLLATASLQVTSVCLIWEFEELPAIELSVAPGQAAPFWHHAPATVQIILQLAWPLILDQG